VSNCRGRLFVYNLQTYAESLIREKGMSHADSP